jgi:hypothetical protein
VLRNHFAREYDHDRGDEAAARVPATELWGPLPAAGTTAANVRLNLDGVLTKG